MPLELNDFIRFLQDKKILIAGFGREGKSSFSFLKKHLPLSQISIADQNENTFAELGKMLSSTQLFSGEDFLKEAGKFDLILKTPGIPMSKFSHIQNPAIISSQSELFLKFFRYRAIGVTGTKGKSTTSSLIHHILQYNGEDSILAGNIGAPIFDYLDTHKGTFVVELSSHQLQQCKYSPHISVLLNIYPEHLDHYKSYEEYSEAKWQIALHQQNEDKIILPLNLYNSIDKNNLLRGKPLIFCYERERMDGITSMAFTDNAIFYFDEMGETIINCDFNRIKLRGKHNKLNMGAAFMAAISYGLSDNEIIEAIYHFEPLSHRLEFVGTFKNIAFYNDSIATIPEAAIAALESIPECDTIILGGYNRGIQYENLIQYILSSNVINLILMGEVGQILKNILTQYTHHKMIFDAPNIEIAVEIAYKYSKPGKACLLSPAASSYDQFKNFEDRGDQFKAAVRKMSV